MQRVLIAAAVVAVVAVVAAIAARRRRADAPTQPRWNLPVQLDRADFPRPDAPWLVVVFSSATCDGCADVVGKASAAATVDVAVTEVEYAARGDLHRRYGIGAVPAVVIADEEGVVRAGFLGPVTANDLWAALAEARRAR